MADPITRLNAALEDRYRIEREIGVGGMATVYLAEDLRHERKVALKVLKPELAAVVGAERFLGEIKTTANLQHPHILPLHDSGEAEGFLYYVMPYVEGESLRDRLDREHQLPVDEAVAIATKVAGALQAAHERGVIHRDIKPANILLSKGEPLVSDFGIALAVGAAGGGRLTETGLSLGTPHYMSPEQATGDHNIGPQTDTYALGCVLYEMLVGEPPYTGPNAQVVLGQIITGEAVSAARKRTTVPLHVDAAIRKALEKLPADRFASAQDLAGALGDSGFRYGEEADAVSARTGGLWNPLSVGTTAVAAVSVALLTWGWLSPLPQAPTERVVRFTFDAPLDFQGGESDLAISPDGSYVVFKTDNPASSGPRLNLRALDELDSRPLRGGENGVGPVISPDGEWVAFLSTGNRTRLQRVSALGGAPVTLAESTNPIVGVSWGRDDQIIFGSQDSGLFRVSPGEEPVELTTLDPGDEHHIWPSRIGDTNAVVFVIVSLDAGPLEGGQLATLDITSGLIRRLGLEGVSPRYVSTGHLVYGAADGSIRAVAFDSGSLRVTGTPTPLIENIAVKRSGAADFDISEGGRLVYAAESGALEERSLVWVDREGREEPIAVPPQPYGYPRLAPDGRRLAVSTLTGEIWIWDFSGETLTRLLTGDSGASFPTWTPDGGRVAYRVEPGSVYWKASNNTGVPELLTEGVGGVGSRTNPDFFTPDGSALVVREQGDPDTSDNLAMISLGNVEEVVWHLAGPFRERNAVLSPNGRWMAYQSEESGEWEVYVRPFPDVESDQVQVSNNGGEEPLWSPNGRELFYLEPGDPGFLISVEIDSGDSSETFEVGGRRMVLEWSYFSDPAGRGYDVSLDGQRFVTVSQGDGTREAETAQITVVLDWFDELRQRMGEQ